jgi:energy-coupling factor transporter ATP-binding protein EcfA2
MYIRSIELTDLRAFKKGKLEFLYPGRKLKRDPFESSKRKDLEDPRFGNINVVLGVNGSGKSTVLDAIAMALQSPIPSSGVTLNAPIRRSGGGKSAQRAMLRLELYCHPLDIPTRSGADHWHEQLECVIQKEGDHEFLSGPVVGDERFKELFIDRSPAFLLLGYGVFRRVEPLSKSELLSSRKKRRSDRYDRVATLFDDDVALIPLTSWFPSIPSGARRDEIVGLINKVTPKTVKFTGKLDTVGEMVFSYRKVELPFSALSDGYRGHLGWLGDMLCRLHEVAPPKTKLTDIPGVVLVDEIDAHLHPAWQQEIIGTLARAFPKIQFIFTTHSPLITGTLERANINVVTRHGSGPPVIEPPATEMYGLSADQILLTDLFGLQSTRDAKFAKELGSLQQAAVQGKAGTAIEFIKKAALGSAGAIHQSAVSPSAQKWLEALEGTKEA